MEYLFCERTSTAFWAEPFNVFSSFGFLVAAIALFVQVNRHSVPLLMVPITAMAAMSMTTAWHHLSLSVTIYHLDHALMALFTLSYIYAGQRLAWGQGRRAAFFWTFAVIPAVAVMVPVFEMMPGASGYALYAPFPAVLLFHSILMREVHPETSDGIFVGACLMVLALVARSADLAMCDRFPIGTHFIWQLLTALTAWWMVQVLIGHHKRERLAQARRELLQSLDDFAIY